MTACRVPLWAFGLAALAGAETTFAAEPVETALLQDRTAPARLVLAHWPKDGWVVRQKGSLAEIIFQNAALDIDLSAVENGALGGTVAGVQAVRGPDSTLLRLEFGCDCRLALHGDGETRLAIDIVGAELPAGPMLAARGPLPSLAPMPPQRRIVASGIAEKYGTPQPGGAAGSNPGDGTRLSADTLDVEAARARLLDQLERAAEAGLIVLDGPQAERTSETQAPAASGRSERNAPAQAMTAAAAKGSPPPMPPANSEVTRAGPETSHVVADPPAPARSRQPEQAKPETPKCLPTGALALPDPLPPGALAARIAQYRRALIGEFDEPNAAAAVSLARLYIANGFGAEARIVLQEFATGAVETPVLAAISHLADGSPLREGHALAGPACKGLHGLWQAVAAARAGLLPGAMAAASSGAALQELPRNLRSQVAIELGLAAASAENWKAARKFQAIAERDRPPGPRKTAKHILLDSALARHHGRDDRALADLQDLWARDWASGLPDAHAALLELARLSEAGGQGALADSHNLRLDLGILAMMARGSETGAHAHLAEVRLTVQAFGRDAALDLLADGYDAGLIGRAAYTAALAELAEREIVPAPGRGEDPPLALLYERDPARYAQALAEPGFRTALARSYAETGAPELGAETLRPEDMADPHLAAVFVRAYLAAGSEADAAEAARNLPEGPRRAALMAQVLLAEGDAEAAFAAAEAAGDALDPALAARIAWILGDWNAAASALERQIAAAPDARAQARLSLATARAAVPAPDREPSREDPLALPELQPFDPTAEGVERFLSGLEAEAKAIQEVLDDG